VASTTRVAILDEINPEEHLAILSIVAQPPLPQQPLNPFTSNNFNVDSEPEIQLHVESDFEY